MTNPLEHLDVLVVGAGLSGIGAAVHLQRELPHASFAVLEARESLGGTWDLFRYPGVRSDSDMHTLGYSFRPWPGAHVIADGPAILDYVRDTAREHGLEQRIRYRRRVVRAEWSTPDARWTVTVEDTITGAGSQLTCGFLLLMCSGYYRYDEGCTPPFRGRDRFSGRIVHPQHWPAELDHTGQRIVVIGSGATAVTLVPALAEAAASVTRLQRTPTYIAARPRADNVADTLRDRLPADAGYALVRWKNVLLTMLSYQLSRRRPELVKCLVRKRPERQLPEGFDLDTHFTPPYDPWNQRFCIAPDGDLFRALRHGSASVVTGQLDTFTETGLRLTDGRELEADLVVTATGLNLLVLGGVELVDGRGVELSETVGCRELMISRVPNLAASIGCTAPRGRSSATSSAPTCAGCWRTCARPGSTRSLRSGASPSCRTCRSSTCGPGTCCARPAPSRDRAPVPPGACTRTTCATGACSAPVDTPTTDCGSRCGRRSSPRGV